MDSDLNGVFTQYSDLNNLFTEDSDLNGILSLINCKLACDFTFNDDSTNSVVASIS